MSTLFQLRVAVLLGCIIFSTTSYATEHGDASFIKIVSPKKGEMVGSTFEVMYELQEGIEAHYVHVFLDGDYQKDVTSLFKNVKPGPHEIMVKVSIDEQGTRVGWDTVDITVK